MTDRQQRAGNGLLQTRGDNTMTGNSPDTSGALSPLGGT